jgi:hypothetical protein
MSFVKTFFNGLAHCADASLEKCKIPEKYPIAEINRQKWREVESITMQKKW